METGRTFKSLEEPPNYFGCHIQIALIAILMPVAALLPRYAAETPFPEVWGRFRCSACGSGTWTFGPIGQATRRPGR